MTSMILVVWKTGRLALAAAAFFSFAAGMRAQEDGDVRAQFAVWRAELPGGEYAVKVGSIDAVSRHAYVVDGAIEVVEVVVATPGASVARFYAMRKAPVDSPSGVGQFVADSVQERAAQLAGRAGAQNLLDSTVVKSYPATTHARTVEFRLASFEEIERLHASLRRAWLSGRGGTFTPGNDKD